MLNKNEPVPTAAPPPTNGKNEHLPDHTGFSFTPTLRTGPTATTLPANNPLPTDFSVCVLGASRGIGAHIALAYAAAGATHLTLTATTLRGLDAVTAEVRALAPAATVIPVACDVGRDADMAALAGAIKQRVPGARLDAVVVNAAYYGELVVDVTAGDPAEFRRVVDTGLTGTYLAAHFLLPLLLATPGGARGFIGVNGLAAWVTGGAVAHTAYCTTKLAQVRLVEHVAEQFGAQGVVAVTVHPGCVATDMAKAAPPEFEKYLVDELGLCGASCVWLSRNKLPWLNGRFISATWDADELLAMREDIVKRDLLKARLAV